ncbi:hypothetical protein KG112_10425 [Nocardioides sp. zg-ZUI104]|uniref:endonuclease/exonuclease/phosphatase family protein n=1 Tax=Nocardioides faecalis TaxID=2803858 RepID=UPI001BCCC369|nr:endonuclease/exonuclease/phosphatase family protein [Nocardioides faecalis]MBS4753217.1 hypothetical protein [Nocardioides faecalis]
MFTRPIRRAVQAVLVVLLCGALVAGFADAGGAARKAKSNPTGVASGSYQNGTKYLKLSLTNTRDGRIKVSWKKPGKYVKKYVVKVGVSRQLDVETRKYKVSRKKRSVIVSRAAGAYPQSGNYTFVKVFVYRKGGGRSETPTKWIQTPIGAACTAAPANRVTVGAFNIRTWTADKGAFSWANRRANVVNEIRRSGARAVAIQEASGQPDQGYGSLPQNEVVLRALNAADTSADWRDAIPQEWYRPLPGSLGGTRVFYDANRFQMLAGTDADMGNGRGLLRIKDKGAPKDTMVPWVRLQAIDAARRPTQAPFILASVHMHLGERLADVQTRGRQVNQVISLLKNLHKKYGDQVVLAGDLNSTVATKPNNNVQRALMRAGFYDAFASARISGAKYQTTNQFKFPLKASPLRRDYILTYGRVKGSCAYVNRVYGSKSQVASDHFMQVASLPLPPL